MPTFSSPEGSVDVKEIKAKGYFAGSVRYLVSWVGYGPAHDTWEPRENLEAYGPNVVLNAFEESENDDARSAQQGFERFEKQPSARKTVTFRLPSPASPANLSKRCDSPNEKCAVESRRKSVAQLYDDWHTKSIANGVRQGLKLREILAIIHPAHKLLDNSASTDTLDADELNSLLYLVSWYGSSDIDVVEHEVLAKYYDDELADFLVSRGARVCS